MALSLAALVADLVGESRELESLVVDLEEDEWDAATPARGWKIRDQVSHLAHSDELATTAALNPVGFVAQQAVERVDLGRLVEAGLAQGRDMKGAELFEWMRRSRRDLCRALRAVDPRARLPWFGPDMSVASVISARLMETFAHGQDIADALGAKSVVSDRLKHVADLGVRTMPNSFRSRGLEVPDASVFVELFAGHGERWAWGSPSAVDQVRGQALEFCLVVTQRRHLLDTRLSVAGPVARAWMSIAQAFAGPPGEGRSPGGDRAI